MFLHLPQIMVCNLMKKANPVWQVILGLSRYPVFNHRTRRTHGNKSSHCYVMLPCVRCVPWFPDLRRQERISVVAAPQYRAAANRAMGWKISNLRTEMTRLLRRADFYGSPDVATCRQTVGRYSRRFHRLAADGYDAKADDARPQT